MEKNKIPEAKIKENRLVTKMGNPLFYKHYWLVIPLSDLPEDMPNLENFPSFKRYSIAREAYFAERRTGRICTYEAMTYIKELENNNLPYVVHNIDLPRKGSGSPFDPKKAKWRGCEWAPAFDEDPDPIWNGHK